LCLGGDGASSSLEDDEDEDEGDRGGSSLRLLEEDFLDACLFFERLSNTKGHKDWRRQKVGGKSNAPCNGKKKGTVSSPISKWECWITS